MSSLTTSARGRKLIEKWEGLYLKAYQDSVGIWTIGYGTISNPKLGIAVYPGLRITEEQADEWLAVEMRDKEAELAKLVKVPLNQNQWDALESFAYNLGTGAVKRSTLLKRLNAGRYDDVPEQLMRFVYAGGKRLRGLENRRRDEVRMWRGEKIDAVPDTPIIRVNPTIIGAKPTATELATSKPAAAIYANFGAALAYVGNYVDWKTAAIAAGSAAIGAIAMHIIDRRGS